MLTTSLHFLAFAFVTNQTNQADSAAARAGVGAPPHRAESSTADNAHPNHGSADMPTSGCSITSHWKLPRFTVVGTFSVQTRAGSLGAKPSHLVPLGGWDALVPK